MQTKIFASTNQAVTYIRHRFENKNAPQNVFLYTLHDTTQVVLEDVAPDEAPLLDALFRDNISPVELFTRGETSSLADWVVNGSVIMSRNSFVKRHALSSALIRHYLKPDDNLTVLYDEEAQGTRDRYAQQAMLTNVLERDIIVVTIGDTGDGPGHATLYLSQTQAESDLPDLLDDVSVRRHVIKDGVSRDIPLRVTREIMYRLTEDDA